MKLRRMMLALAPLLGAGPALATWSIVVVDTRTREVGIAGATCIPTTALDASIAVVRVGQGVAAAQSLLDVSGNNRIVIWEDIQLGVGTRKILDHLSVVDPGHQTRQYGIVTLADPVATTFTGSGAGNANHGVTGQVGSLRYAIQGNLLTGAVVVTAAEAALLATEGDLSQRLMAAMEAARAMGGDGRCSCGPNTPTQCGAPPRDFVQSAQSAFIIVGRIGDQNGTCTAGGCSSGNYWLRLRTFEGPVGGDPVTELEEEYAAWRASKLGAPDHYHTKVTVDRRKLAADGESAATVVIEPADIDGVPLGRPGLVVRVLPLGSDPPLARVGPIEDRGDGTYAFKVRAGTTPGHSGWRVIVRDGPQRARLYPDLHFKLVGVAGGP